MTTEQTTEDKQSKVNNFHWQKFWLASKNCLGSSPNQLLGQILKSEQHSLTFYTTENANMVLGCVFFSFSNTQSNILTHTLVPLSHNPNTQEELGKQLYQGLQIPFSLHPKPYQYFFLCDMKTKTGKHWLKLTFQIAKKYLE